MRVGRDVEEEEEEWAIRTRGVRMLEEEEEEWDGR